MTDTIKTFSLKNFQSSFVVSLGIHALIYGSLVWILSVSLSKKEPAPEYVDLGYQTFDAPPEPTQEVKRVVKSAEPETPVDTNVQPDTKPQEMQDEKGVVSGTQVAAKQTATIGSDSTGTAASTPYYKIKPKYPVAALQAGTEGWVLMQIDINEEGAVENIRVVDGEQRNLFQTEAKRAVAQWKYRPFVDGSGKPLKKSDHQVRVDFRLQDNES